MVRRPILALLLVGSLPWIPGRKSAGQVPEPAGSFGGTLSPEEATPDCEADPPDPFPARERARHLALLGVDSWHAAGYRGRGVKIAVLDSGFRGYRSQLGKALPARVTARSFRADGNLEAKPSQHGVLCAEVLHALAPDAELLLANWDPTRPDEFLAAARWAREQGARVFSCSVIMPSWSDGEGGGLVNQTLAQIIGPGDRPADLLFFASAGNTAQRHWSGPFQDDGHGWHAWRPGQTGNTLRPWSPGTVSVELYWHPGAEYELTVCNAATGLAVGRGTWCGDKDRCCAVVHFLPQALCTYEVRVRLAGGRGGPFHLVALGGSLSWARAPGSVACPADGPAVLAVAAVNRQGQRAGYSSCGPNSRQPKPDFAAPVPFPSLWRPRPFTGTSAAAPQAAALAALCWSRHPDWTAAQVRAALRATARDLGPPGLDYETGYGMICLPGKDFEPPGALLLPASARR
jgi:subtilisin family serine protease